MLEARCVSTHRVFKGYSDEAPLFCGTSTNLVGDTNYVVNTIVIEATSLVTAGIVIGVYIGGVGEGPVYMIVWDSTSSLAK